MKHILIRTGIFAMLLTACSSPDTSFVSGGSMDPYCEDVETWRETLTVRAEYTDDGNISLLLDTGAGNGLVELTGEVTIEGAAVNFVYFDIDSLWYVLVPEEDVTGITIVGLMMCTAAEEHYTVTLTLSPDDGEIEYTLEFGVVGDAGVEADGGV